MRSPIILSHLQRRDLIRHVTMARSLLQSIDRHQNGIARVLRCNPHDKTLMDCIYMTDGDPESDVDHMLSTMGIMVTDHVVAHNQVTHAMHHRKSLLDRFFNTQDEGQS